MAVAMKTTSYKRLGSTFAIAALVVFGSIWATKHLSPIWEPTPLKTVNHGRAYATSPVAPIPTPKSNLFANTECEDWHAALVAQRIPSPEDQRRQKFEEEYGVHQQTDSPVVQAVLGTQYRIDDVLFNLQEASVHEYPLCPGSGDAQAIDTDNPLLVVLRDAKVKTVISTHDKQTDSRFVGVKLVFPVGD
jgi:hypothetical protein